MVGSLGWWTKATKGGHADTIGPEKEKKKLDNTVTAGCGGGGGGRCPKEGGGGMPFST